MKTFHHVVGNGLKPCSPEAPPTEVQMNQSDHLVSAAQTGDKALPGFMVFVEERARQEHVAAPLYPLPLFLLFLLVLHLSSSPFSSSSSSEGETDAAESQ